MLYIFRSGRGRWKFTPGCPSTTTTSDVRSRAHQSYRRRPNVHGRGGEICVASQIDQPGNPDRVCWHGCLPPDCSDSLHSLFHQDLCDRGQTLGLDLRPILRQVCHYRCDCLGRGCSGGTSIGSNVILSLFCEKNDGR